MNPRPHPADVYDVVVMGGGPTGSTFATLLAQRTGLKIGLFEKEHFPREHIGESFSHRVIQVLSESGALEKVLASDCWIQKFGGIYSWDPRSPSIALFDHDQWEADGVLRWAIHVNRPDFDAILLDHCRSTGVEVFEGTAVRGVKREGEHHRVALDDGREVRARWFIEASGRQTSLVQGRPKAFLSQYRNVAIWNHFLYGIPAEELPIEFGLFRERKLSPIGCFAFDRGWIWYIPVRRLVNGRRVTTHSIGIVTDPRVLKTPGGDFRKMENFLACVRSTPLLEGLVERIEPIHDHFQVATNYSMISDRLADFDDRWMLLGDSGYFVDPLFSSGVSHGLNQAASAARLLAHVEQGGFGDDVRRDLMVEYDQNWRRVAHSFALAIDQWYYAISRAHPESYYWSTRSSAPSADLSRATLHPLVDTLFGPDLLQVLTHGTRSLDDLGDGPWRRVCGVRRKNEPEPSARVAFAPNVAVKDSFMLGMSATVQPPASYWADPVRRAAQFVVETRPTPCRCFVHPDPEGTHLRAPVGGTADALVGQLTRAPAPYAALAAEDPELVRGLWRGGFLEVTP